jgi:hypothetical protein
MERQAEARQDRISVNHNHKATEVEYLGSSESKATRTSKDDEGENKNEMFDSELAVWDL